MSIISERQKPQHVILRQISPILVDVQHGNRSINVLLEKMEEAFLQSDPRLFSEVLWRVMVVGFVENKNEYAARLVDFFFKVVTMLAKSKTNTEDDNCQSFSVCMLRLSVKHNNDVRPAVRLRICETIESLLQTLTKLDEQFGNGLADKLAKVLLDRLQDKVQHVRAVSAKALAKLASLHTCQTDTEQKDRIINELMHHLKWDPSVEVRVAISKSTQFTPENYSCLIEKVNDLSEEVRKTAIQTIGEQVSVDVLSIQNRERILQSSLADKSAAVRKHGEDLLKQWITFWDGNIITFLTKLDVTCNKRTAELALKALFAFPTHELFDEMVDRTIFVNKFIPIDSINQEKAFYWRFIVETFSTIPSVAELILPTIPDMCAYLQEFVSKFADIKHRTASQNMLAQILKICFKIPVEEGGRQIFIETLICLFTFPNLSMVTIKLMLHLFYQYQRDDVEQSLIQILEKMLENNKIVEPAQRQSVPIPQPMSIEEQKQLKIEVGTLIHLRHKKDRDKTLAVNAQNYLRAQELQDEINALVEDIERLRNKMSRNDEITSNNMINDEDEVEKQQYAPFALNLTQRALIIHIRHTRTVSTEVRAFYDSYVAPEMCNEEADVRKNVLTLLTLLGLACQEDANDAVIVCAQALIFDESTVKVRAIRCLVDLIQHYGFDEFMHNDKLNEIIANVEPKNQSILQLQEKEIDSPLRGLLMHYFRNDDEEVVKNSVTGIIKLLLANRLSATKIVKALLRLWSNPANESSTMYHEISTWLPMFVKMGYEQAHAVGEALIPCLQDIRAAPKVAYLAHASVEKLISFVFTHTDQKYLACSCISNPELVHEELAFNILIEMKRIGTGPAYISYAKSLKTLNLQNCSEESIKKLKKKTLHLLKSTSIKTSLSLKAFLKYLNTLYQNDVNHDKGSNSSSSGSDSSDEDGGSIEMFNSSSDADEYHSVGEEEDDQEIIGATPEH